MSKKQEDQEQENMKHEEATAAKADEAAVDDEVKPAEDDDTTPSDDTKSRPRAARAVKSANVDVKKKKKAKWKPTHPNSTIMCVEAIEYLKEAKGSSGMAIKKYILSTYETVRPDMVNYMVRTALTKGLQTGVFVRPKGDESGGAHGRFRVGKKPDMPKISYKSASKKKSPRKKGTKNKKTEKKDKSRKSKKSSSKKKKKTKPSTKATLKVKASPKPKRVKT